MTWNPDHTRHTVLKFFLHSLALACTIVLLSTVAMGKANETLAVLEPMTIAIGKWPPFLSTTLKHHGPIAHLITDVFAAEGLAVTFVSLPWARAYRETALGKYDATGVWMHQADREADFLYSDEVLTETFVFFHRKDFAFDWTSLDDLTNLRITGGIQYSYGPELDAALASKKLKIIRLPTKEQNIKMLLAKRADIWPEEQHVATDTLQRSFETTDSQQLTYHSRPYLRNKSYLLFPKTTKSSQQLQQSFNKRLADFRQSGRYEQYLEAYRRGDYIQKTAPTK